MDDTIEHFRTLARRIEANQLAWNAQLAVMNESITAETIKLRELERRPIPASAKAAAQSEATLRKLKAEKAKAKPPSFVNPLADVERYAATHRNAEALPAVELPAGETPLAAYKLAVKKTDKVLAEISRTRTAPIDDPAAIEAQIDALARPARIDNGRLTLPRQVIRGHGGTVLSVVNVEGLVAWLLRDQLVAALAKPSGGGEGMTRAARDAALAKLIDKFAAAIRIEAAAAMAAEKADFAVMRRRHVHPAVLLGVKASAKEIFDWHANRKGAA